MLKIGGFWHFLADHNILTTIRKILPILFKTLSRHAKFYMIRFINKRAVIIFGLGGSYFSNVFYDSSRLRGAIDIYYRAAVIHADSQQSLLRHVPNLIQAPSPLMVGPVGQYAHVIPRLALLELIMGIEYQKLSYSSL
jgi:hypothetical protein